MPYRLVHNSTPPDIAIFRSLKGKGGPFERGLFIAESEKIARKVLESGFAVPMALMTEEHFEHFRTTFDQRSDDTEVFLASKEEMEQIVGYHLHQGVMLAVRIPESRSVAEAALEWQSPWMAIALDGIADAENMGGIIRNAAAFGATAVIVDGTSCNPWLRRSVRVSMGTIVDVEIIRVADLVMTMGEIRKIGPIQMVGASLSEKSVDLPAVPSFPNALLAFGSEGWGLRKEVAETCDVLARIPIAPSVDSLNVAVASGIFMERFRK